ncbi:outer membrane protein [Devosia sp. A16]|uniref:outer membrane protein n=1 Tax=Devosia sp. A16 TaxID=1736675 RepID=UPI0009E8E685|nr:outer membrane protein [Devosia sp. A16]
MNRTLTAAALALILTSGAHAADLIVDVDQSVVAPVDLRLFDWSGAYVGGHIGYVSGQQSDNLPPLPEGGKDPLPQFPVEDQSGAWLGGLHAGYNWQSGGFVYGLEGDVDFTGLKRGKNFNTYNGNISLGGSLFMESDVQASLRARAGLAIDSWLLYGAAGIAVARAEVSVVGNPNSITYPLVSDTNTHVGWTIGAGIETAFSPNWIGRVEARYTDFGAQAYDLGAFGEAVESRWRQTSVNLGLSYKF